MTLDPCPVCGSGMAPYGPTRRDRLTRCGRCRHEYEAARWQRIKADPAALAKHRQSRRTAGRVQWRLLKQDVERLAAHRANRAAKARERTMAEHAPGRTTVAPGARNNQTTDSGPVGDSAAYGAPQRAGEG